MSSRYERFRYCLAQKQAKFDAQVDRSGGPDACWPWTGRLDPRGYGNFWTGRSRPGAHAFALSKHLGRPLRDGYGALHKCDNPPCCNPAHLYEGTQRDNMLDRVSRATPKLTPKLKVTAAQVSAIQARVAAAGLSHYDSRRRPLMTEIAREHGISVNHAYVLAPARHNARLAVRTAIHAGGIDPMNHSRRLLPVTRQGRARNKAARALESVLRMYADPLAKRLKVRTALKAGGLEVMGGQPLASRAPVSRVTPIAFMDSDRYSTFVEARRAHIRRERLRFLGWCAAIIVLSVIVSWVVVGWWMS